MKRRTNNFVTTSVYAKLYVEHGKIILVSLCHEPVTHMYVNSSLVSFSYIFLTSISVFVSFCFVWYALRKNAVIALFEHRCLQEQREPTLLLLIH